MGTAAEATLSIEDEARIGRMVMRGLRDSGHVLEDPETNEYLQSLGLRLSSLAHDGNRDFNFFLVRDPPSMRSRCRAGTSASTRACCSPRTGRASWPRCWPTRCRTSPAAHRPRSRELGACEHGLDGGNAGRRAARDADRHGSDATMGAIAATQGMAAQSQISFTRENEYEADRVGIGLLAAAGFDPGSMAGFFDTMGRRTQLAPDRVPELLRTHPVTSARIAEARGRAAAYLPSCRATASATRSPRNGCGCSLRRPGGSARVLRLGGRRLARYGHRAGVRQGAGAARFERAGRGDSRPSCDCATSTRKCCSSTPRSARRSSPPADAGRAQHARAGARPRAAQRAGHHPLCRGAAAGGRPKRAHEVLLDLFNNVTPSQEQIRLTAMAANAAGDVADAYAYMAEYHIMGGDLPLAINQLELALSVPGLTSVQRARFIAA